MEARGYAADEVREQYARARELCLKLDDRARLVPVLLGFSTIAEVAGRYLEADELACELLRLADDGIGSRESARNARGWPLFCTGRLAEALDCLAPLLHEPGPDAEQPIGGAHDSVEALCISAWTLWFLGRPDEAALRSSEAIAFARRLDHPFSLVFALTCARSCASSAARPSWRPNGRETPSGSPVSTGYPSGRRGLPSRSAGRKPRAATPTPA